jgi:hypothetical protein
MIMRKKIIIAIIFIIIIASLFVSVFSIKWVAQNIPGIPTDFTATVMSRTRIDLVWTKGDKADTTYIERNTTSPWSIGKGTPIYNDTGASYQDTGLSQNSHYYYQAWSWNQTDYVFSTTFAAADNTTFANQPPIFALPSPVNGSTNNPLSLTWNISINDPQGNTFTWNIQCNNGQVNSGSGASNGTKSLSLSGLVNSTSYKIWVNATDPTGSGLYTRRWFTFTTKANNPPMFGTPSPPNGSTGNSLSFSWSIPINDPEGAVFSWTIQCSNGQVNSSTGASNGTKSLALSGLAYSISYKVWVNATDPAGSGLYTRRWFTFTTQGSSGNNPPVFGVPSPANGSTGNLLSLTWSIPISDPEGTVFSWTIQCNNGQVTSGTSTSNGTKSLSLSGLAYSMTYKVWVNATDPTGSGLYTRKWYTFTAQQQNLPPNKPNKPSGQSNGKIRQEYSYTTSTTDSDGDQVYYQWDWGDGTQSEWLGPFASGAQASAQKSWTAKGDYSIKVKSKDIHGAESAWSDPLPITMPYSYNKPILQFLGLLFLRFPNAFPLLRQLLGY